jgi:hypothetical protein
MIDHGVAIDSFVLAVMSVLPLILIPWIYLHESRAARADQEAEERAAALLRRLLSDGERRQLEQHQYLAVQSPSTADRVYWVPAKKGWVEVYDSSRLTMRLCVEPMQPLPPSDLVLMHKLMIEGSESEYLRQANVLSDPCLPRARAS